MKTMIAVVAGALTVAAGCGGDEAQEGRTTPSSGQEEEVAACPFELEDAHVSVRDTDEGVALTFTTDRTENVADLRQRVHAMALLIPGDHDTRAIGSVVDVPTGARLQLSATDRDDLASLRQEASIMAEDIRDRRSCPIMWDEAPV